MVLFCIITMFSSSYSFFRLSYILALVTGIPFSFNTFDCLLFRFVRCNLIWIKWLRLKCVLSHFLWGCRSTFLRSPIWNIQTKKKIDKIRKFVNLMGVSKLNYMRRAAPEICYNSNIFLVARNIPTAYLNILFSVRVSLTSFQIKYRQIFNAIIVSKISVAEQTLKCSTSLRHWLNVSDQKLLLCVRFFYIAKKKRRMNQ